MDQLSRDSDPGDARVGKKSRKIFLDTRTHVCYARVVVRDAYAKQKAQVLSHLGSLPGGGCPQQERLSGLDRLGQGLGVFNNLN